MHLSKFRYLVFGFCATLIVLLGIGCHFEEFDPLEKRDTDGGFRITATIPHHGQFNVPHSSGIVIHFSKPINPTSVSGKLKIERVSDAYSEVIEELVDAETYVLDYYEASIIINPNPLWQPRTIYRVTVENGIKSEEGAICTEDRLFIFETGVRRPKMAEALSVERIVPDLDDPDQAYWDFQTLRVYFNEPIDRTTLKYGESVTFTDKETGELVAGNVFGRGNIFAFDPHEDLTAGNTYTLTITTALKDHNGEGIDEDFTTEFQVKSTGRRTILAMDNCPTVVEDSAFCEALPENDLFPKSKFIGNDINSMLAESLLLGDTNILVGSRLWNEFGQGSLSPNRVPIVVRKGQKLFGKGLKGVVGGEGGITSGIDTGLVTVTLLTDATGELLGSEYVHGVPGLPATIVLTMDAVMNAENPTASTIFSQPIMGATLVGQASVQPIDKFPGYETMIIELVGYSEIELIKEYVPVTMALKMVPPPELPHLDDPTKTPIVDVDPPEVSSVSPVEITAEDMDITHIFPTRSAADEIIVTFSEPIDPATVEENCYVIGPGGKVSGTTDIYNSKVAITPDEPLMPDTEYTVVILSGIKDIVGNPLGEDHYDYKFRTMAYQSSDTEPPRVNAIDPGDVEGAVFPCNFLLGLYFSHIMEESTFIYGDTYGLYDVTDGNKLVPATLMFYGTYAFLVVDEFLIQNHSYRIVITDQLTNIDGVQLDTDVVPDHTPGGQEPGQDKIEVKFTASSYSAYSQAFFMMYPYADTNVNGLIDENEYELDGNYMDPDFPLISGRAFVMGYFPITIQPLIMDVNGDPRVPIFIEPASDIFGTNLSISLFSQDKQEWSLFDMGRIWIELLYPSTSDIFQDSDGLVGVDTVTTMDFVVENKIINNLLNNRTYMDIPSKLRFTKDGRMVVLIQGRSSVEMDIPIIGTLITEMDVKLGTSTPPTIRGF